VEQARRGGGTNESGDLIGGPLSILLYLTNRMEVYESTWYSNPHQMFYWLTGVNIGFLAVDKPKK
jgi:hypothetical protein